uniref:Uncharacterized protein n=1 Tax=Sphaerodactylus townsendi TaxID=933632 RepID=A0ACB8E8B9_9SAUR
MLITDRIIHQYTSIFAAKHSRDPQERRHRPAVMAVAKRGVDREGGGQAGNDVTRSDDDRCCDERHELSHRLSPRLSRRRTRNNRILKEKERGESL